MIIAFISYTLGASLILLPISLLGTYLTNKAIKRIGKTPYGYLPVVVITLIVASPIINSANNSPYIVGLFATFFAVSVVFLVGTLFCKNKVK